MPLMFNGDRLMPYGGVVGATLMDGGNRMSQSANTRNEAAYFNQALHFNSRASTPDGARHPIAWVMPRVAGGLAARNTIIGSGAAAANVQSGYNIEATLSGAGGISGSIGLIVSIAATLVASGGISSASVDALASMVASLTGSGDITATAAGLADLGAVITGSGSVNASNTALADIAATIRGYGDLTPEGIRDAVWAAAQSLINIPGSAGAALLAAGSAGDPWSTALPGSYPAGTAGAILSAIINGLTPAQQAQLLDVWQRLGLDPANPQVTTDATIVAGGVSQTITESPGPTITVTRAP
jgi:hypothetical protein